MDKNEVDLEALRKIRARMSEIVQGTHDTRSEALVDLRELISWAHKIDAELTARRARDKDVEALVGLLQDAVCPMKEQGCDGTQYPVGDPHGHWSGEQCQWCYERNLVIAAAPAQEVKG